MQLVWPKFDLAKIKKQNKNTFKSTAMFCMSNSLQALLLKKKNIQINGLSSVSSSSHETNITVRQQAASQAQGLLSNRMGTILTSHYPI